MRLKDVITLQSAHSQEESTAGIVPVIVQRTQRSFMIEQRGRLSAISLSSDTDCL